MTNVMEDPLISDHDSDNSLTTNNATVKKKIMPCCTPTCQKWTLFGFAVGFLIIGLVLAIFTDDIVYAIKDDQLNLGSNKTTEYTFWKETPIPMYIEFYLFNWNNSEEVRNSNWNTKPKFNQMGPYTFHEKHYRKNVIFNDNHTLTYQTQRVWHFAPERTTGSLDDLVTTVNPILLTVGNIVKYKHTIVKMGVNFFLEEKRINFTVTKTVKEFIFDGYEDPMLDLLRKLHLKSINIPFTKFAWFADRNGSVEYDGTYNMFDGTDDIRKVGRFSAWNYQDHTEYYENECGVVNGTSGELWYPVEDDVNVRVFSPDICSTLTLVRNGDEEMYGIEGHKYVADERTLDNGTAHPEMSCFSPGEVLPSGVRNISQCKFGAPAFFSYPHFYLADPFYRDSIEGMVPNKTEHELLVALEPNTGIPLEARVAAQLNLRVEEIDRIKLLKGVKTHYFPVLWFKQFANIDEVLVNQAKILITLPAIGQYTGFGVLGLGCLFLFAFGFLTWKKYWKGSDEEGLLNQDNF